MPTIFRTIVPRAIALGCLLLLLGCATHRPYQPANRVLADAHVGGSVVAIDPDSRRLASGGWEGMIRLWRLPAGEKISSHWAHQGQVTAISFLEDGERWLSAGYDGHLSLWGPQGKRRVSVATGSPIMAMAIDSANRRVFTGHNDGFVRVWHLPELLPVQSWSAHQAAVRALAWHRESHQLASSGSDGQVLLWPAPGQAVPLPRPSSDARTLVFSRDGSELFGAGWFKLYRWRLADRQLTRLATEHFGIINAIHLTPDGALASISRQTDAAVLILDPETGATLKRFQPHDLCGADVAVSPDGRYLATTSDDASVRIWDLQHPLPPR